MEGKIGMETTARVEAIEQDEILSTGEGLLLAAALSAVVVSLLTFVLI